ncbi:hypothetical protein Tco_0432021 [Tanacetum coccineum]
MENYKLEFLKGIEQSTDIVSMSLKSLRSASPPPNVCTNHVLHVPSTAWFPCSGSLAPSNHVCSALDSHIHSNEGSLIPSGSRFLRTRVMCAIDSCNSRILQYHDPLCAACTSCTIGIVPAAPSFQPVPRVILSPTFVSWEIVC